MYGGVAQPFVTPSCGSFSVEPLVSEIHRTGADAGCRGGGGCDVIK